MKSPFRIVAAMLSLLYLIVGCRGADGPPPAEVDLGRGVRPISRENSVSASAALPTVIFLPRTEYVVDVHALDVEGRFRTDTVSVEVQTNNPEWHLRVEALFLAPNAVEVPADGVTCVLTEADETQVSVCIIQGRDGLLAGTGRGGVQDLRFYATGELPEGVADPGLSLRVKLKGL
ncbi:MAG: hypothetical protein KAW17_01870 [Candidatus Eisenbacteria sp.]|nr:hypothetical protein [Candidatus Eisenbacteria bacterium]